MTEKFKKYKSTKNFKIIIVFHLICVHLVCFGLIQLTLLKAVSPKTTSTVYARYKNLSVVLKELL